MTKSLFFAILSTFVLQTMIAPPSFFTPFRTMVDKPCFELGTCPPKFKQSEERRRGGKSELPLEKSNVRVVDNVHLLSLTRIGTGKCHRDYTSPDLSGQKVKSGLMSFTLEINGYKLRLPVMGCRGKPYLKKEQRYDLSFRKVSSFESISNYRSR